MSTEREVHSVDFDDDSDAYLSCVTETMSTGRSTPARNTKFNDGSDTEGTDYDYEELATPTKRKREAILRVWTEFMLKRGVSKRDSVRYGRPQPRVKELQKFIDYYIHRSPLNNPNRGPRKSLPTTHTMAQVFRSFYGGYESSTRTKFDRKSIDNILLYISKVCPKKHNVSTKQKEKHILLPSDLDNLIAALWCSDLCNISHGRQRIQLTLCLLLHAYTGARAGTFIEGCDYRGTKRCLTYKDVRLHVFYDPEGNLRYMVEITHRFTKGNPDTSENTTRMTMTSREDILRDPTIFFVALALADNALKDISSVEQFSMIKPPPGEKTFEFRWNAKVLDRPVFRGVSYSEGVTEEAWNCKQMFHQLGKLIECAGYKKGSITIHTVRRGFANAIERDPTLTREEKNQAMGYTPGSKTFGKSYISRVSIVDGQALFLKESPQREHIEMLRSAARYRVTALPQQLPAQQAKDFEASPLMTALALRLEALPPNEKDERKKINTERYHLRHEALIDYQGQWAQDEYRQHVSTGSIATTEKNDCKATQNLSPAEIDFQELRPFVPERSRVADLAGKALPLSGLPRTFALHDLTVLCRRDERVLYLPREHPFKGRCPVIDCGQEIESLSLKARSLHTHACRHREIARATGWSMYCYRCLTWFQKPEEWSKHCQWHLENLDMSCEIRVNRYTLVHPGTCIFCLNDTRLPAAARMDQWTSPGFFYDHVAYHLQSVSWPIACPHPLCDLEIHNHEQFNCHMIDVHSKGLHTKAFGRFEKQADGTSKSKSALTKRKYTRSYGTGTRQPYEKIPLDMVTFPVSPPQIGLEEALRQIRMKVPDYESLKR